MSSMNLSKLGWEILNDPYKRKKVGDAFRRHRSELHQGASIPVEISPGRVLYMRLANH